MFVFSENGCICQSSFKKDYESEQRDILALKRRKRKEREYSGKLRGAFLVAYLSDRYAPRPRPVVALGLEKKEKQAREKLAILMCSHVRGGR